MVDYIGDNFAVWAKYHNRSIGEGWTRFAERIVGVDDDGNVVYKNTEAAQVEDSGGTPRDLYKYDNTFGGIILGDTGVPVRINVDAWNLLEAYDASNSYNFVMYNDTPQNNDVPYYDTGEWKIGDVGGTHNHDTRYVNTTGGDSMEGPLQVTTSGGAGITGNVVVYSGYIFADGGNVGFNNDYKLYGYNNAQTLTVDLIQVSDADAIDVGDSSYNMNLIPGPGLWIGYGSNLAAPFYDLDNWITGYLPAWNTSNNRFESLDPDVLVDYKMDADQYLQGHDGTDYKNLIGHTDGTPPTIIIGDITTDAMTIQSGAIEITALDPAPDGDVTITSTNDDVSIVAGDDIYLSPVDDLELEATGGTVGLFRIINMRVLCEEYPVQWQFYDSGSTSRDVIATAATDELHFGSSSWTVNIKGSATRPTYNSSDLALLSDAGGGPGTDTSAIHDDEANEITAITEKTSLVDADEFVIEDSAASYVKKAVTATNLASYVDSEVVSGAYLPLTAGSGEPLTGNLHIETTTTPQVILKENAVADSYTVLRDGGGVGAIYKTEPTASAVVRLDPLPDDGYAAIIQCFRTTNTSSGSRYMDIHVGDGTAEVQHRFLCSGDFNICQNAGQLTVGGTGGAYRVTVKGGGIGLDNTKALWGDTVGSSYVSLIGTAGPTGYEVVVGNTTVNTRVTCKDYVQIFGGYLEMGGEDIQLGGGDLLMENGDIYTGTGDIILDNNTALYRIKNAASTAGTVMYADSGDDIHIGDVDLKFDDVYFVCNGVSYDFYFNGAGASINIRESGIGGYVHLCHAGSSSNVYLGDTGGETTLQGTNVILDGSAAVIVDGNNIPIQFDDSGGTPRQLLLFGSSNNFIVGNTNYQTRYQGITSSASDPSSSELGTGQYGVHKNTTSGITYFAYNDGGTIKKAALTD